MKAMNHRGGWVVVLGIAWGMCAGGCAHNLFSASTDAPRDSKIDKYWGGDSAIKTTEGRRKSSEMGFGYPSGSGN